jgi:hemin uptake protein HemP
MEPGETAKQLPMPAQSKPRVQATALLQGHREVIIEHGNEEYRLRLTRQGKLLLTK